MAVVLPHFVLPACQRNQSQSIDTAILVEVTSDLAVPSEIDQVRLTSEDLQGQILFDRIVSIGVGQNRVPLPFRAGLYPLHNTATAIDACRLLTCRMGQDRLSIVRKRFYRFLMIVRAMPTPPSHVRLTLVGGQNRQAASDGDVARGLMAGEEWATVEAWQRFAPMVMTMAKHTLGSHTDAEDITQEAFCQVYRKVRTLHKPESLRGFIYSCALRLLQTELRRKKLRSWLSFEEPEVLNRRASTTLDMESRNLLRRLYALLDRLGSRDRLIFVLNRMESMGVEEIAISMEISESTVKRSLAHASDRIRHWIDAEPRWLKEEERGS